MSKIKYILVFAFFALLLLPALVRGYCKPVINLAPTVSFCQGNSITLNAFNANATYKWSNGAATPSIVVSTSGTYWVKVTNVCGTAFDTVQVYVDSPVNFNLGMDRTMCSTNSPVLSAPSCPSCTYLWQNNSTSRQIPVTQSGKYYVKVTNACGTYSDTVKINLHDPVNVNLGPDINYCSPGTHTLSIPNTAKGTVQWSTGQTGKSIAVNTSDTYWVKVTNQCGVFTDTVRVTFEQGKLLDIGNLIGKCNNLTVTLTANVGGGTYLWSTNATTQSIVVSNPGTYWVKFTDNCGVYYDTATVYNKGLPNVNLGSDIRLCYGDSVQLDAGNPGSYYSWSDGTSSQKNWVDTTGLYYVNVNNGCGVDKDSIYVEAIIPPIDSIGDSAFYCIGSYIDVDAKYWGVNSYYYWDDGTGGRYHRYSTPGSHWVKVGNECDTLHLDFYVEGMNHKSFDLGPDTAVCGSYDLKTHLSEVRNKFVWSNSTDKSETTVYSSGEYWVQVENACGIYNDTVYVEILKPPQLAIFTDPVICNGIPVQLFAYPDTMTSYLWNTGDTTKTILADTAGWYRLYASNICDSVADSIYIDEGSDIIFSLGNDTVICAPNSVALDVTGLDTDSIRWDNGSGNGLRFVSRSGVYWVTLYNACGEFSDTISVQVEPDPGGKVTDKAICIGDSVELDAYKPFITSYSWNTGSNLSSIMVDTAGWYWVDLLTACGWTRDSIEVRVDQPIQPFSLGNDTIFCSGSIWLDPGYIPGATYLWQDLTRSRMKRADRSGTYYVTVSNACNSYTDSINILITGPPIEVLGDTVRFCVGSTFTLNAQNPGSTYLWNDGSTGQYLSSDTTGKYWVTIENPCGKLTDTVILVTDEPLDNLELGSDTIICRGQTLQLSTGYFAPGITTVWSTGASTPTINVSTTDKYWVSIMNTCGIWADTIFVEVLDVPVFTLGPDSVICAIDGRVDLFGPEGEFTYRWSTGEATKDITATKAGTYWLEVDNTCFTYVDSIFLKEEYPIEMDLGSDTVLCFGESLFLSPGNVGYPLHWNGNFNGLTKEVTRTSEHWVWAENSCGVFSDTIMVWFDIPVDPYPIDTIVCGGDSAIFDLTNKRFDVEWFDGKRNVRRGFTEEGVYGAILTNTCGTFPKDFKVDIDNCDCPLFAPSAFTPDGDGINDSWVVGFDCSIISFEITVFDRWGKIQLHTTDSDFHWGGVDKGSPLAMGAYHYLIDYSWSVYGVIREERVRGVVNIIR